MALALPRRVRGALGYHLFASTVRPCRAEQGSHFAQSANTRMRHRCSSTRGSGSRACCWQLGARVGVDACMRPCNTCQPGLLNQFAILQAGAPKPTEEKKEWAPWEARQPLDPLVLYYRTVLSGGCIGCASSSPVVTRPSSPLPPKLTVALSPPLNPQALPSTSSYQEHLAKQSQEGVAEDIDEEDPLDAFMATAVLPEARLRRAPQLTGLDPLWTPLSYCVSLNHLIISNVDVRLLLAERMREGRGCAAGSICQAWSAWLSVPRLS